VVAEWNAFAPFLNPKRCLVAFHDTRLDPREAVGVKRIHDRLTLGDERLFLPELRDAMTFDTGVYLPDYKYVSLMPLRNMRGLDILFLSNEELPEV